MSKNFFISATGTEIGKTFFTTQICKKSTKYQAIKPVISGIDDYDANSLKQSDSGLILEAMNQEINLENIEKISPWRFKHALSPDMAMEIENKELNFAQISEFCHEQLKSSQKSMLIEGVGGIMSPINQNSTNLDLAKILQIPIILVCGNYLGSISHTLSAIEAIKAQNLEIACVFVNDIEKTNLPTIEQTLKTLRNFSKVKFSHEIEEIYQIITF